MTLIGFHYKKMIAERKKKTVGKININTNIQVKKVQEAKVNVGSAKQAGIEFTFEFKTKYEPHIAELTLEAVVVYLGAADKVKETLESYNKSKQLPPDVLKEVYNFMLSKCNIQALVLSKDMGLPPQIKLPKVEAK